MIKHLKTIAVFALFMLPFAVRLAYMIDTWDQDYMHTPILISAVHHYFAQDLMDRTDAPYTVFRPPYYPLFMSMIYKAAGVFPMAVKIVQWILGALSCWLIYLLAFTYYGRKQAVIALIISSLYAPSFFFEGMLLEHPLASFLALASVYLIAVVSFKRSDRTNPVALYLSAAVLFGLSCMIRPDMLFAAPALIASLCIAPVKVKERIKSAVLFTCITGLFIALINHPQSVIPVDENHQDINAAINLYLGNNLTADGVKPYCADVQEMSTDHPEARKYHITGLTLSMILYARAQTGEALDAVAPYWNIRTWSFITESPIQSLKLFIKKCFLFFNGFITTNQKDIYFMRQFSTVLKALLFNVWFICFPLGLIIPLAIMALIFERSVCRRLLIAAVPFGCLLTVTLFLNCGRFVYPSVPFFIVLASEGIFVIANKLRQKNWIAGSLFLTLLLVSNLDLFKTHVVRYAQESLNVGEMYLADNDADLAESFFKQSLEYDPLSERAIVALCHLYSTQNQPDKIISLINGLPESEATSSWAAMYGMASAYLQEGDLSQSLTWSNKLLEKYPDNPDSYLLTASVYLRNDKSDDALKTLAQGSLKCPQYSPLLIQYGALLAQTGYFEKSLAIMKNVLSRTTHYPEAFYYAGYALVSFSRFDQAEDLLRNGLVHHPDDISMLFTLAQALEGMKKPNQALDCYRKIIAIQPENSEAFMRVAELLARFGKYEDALRTATAAKQLGHPDADKLIENIQSLIPQP